METAATTTKEKQTMATPMDNYASVGRRWVASFIDGLLLGVIGFVLNLPGVLMATSARASGNSQTAVTGDVVNIILSLVGWVIQIAYFVFFIGRTGQTLGKKAMGIKVVKVDTMDHPTYLDAFLREVVGKFLSAIVFLLGYLWAFWDPRKQTWHDKIAKTVVVKV